MTAIFNLLHFRVRAILFLLLCTPAVSAGEFVWALRAGGSGNDFGRAVASDASGNCYVTGGFSGTAEISGRVLISEGGHDIFLAKYNPNGQLVWLAQGSGPKDAFGWELSPGPAGSIYLAGVFTGSLKIGDTQIGVDEAQHMFIARFDAQGKLDWLQQVGGAGSAFLDGLAVDSTGHPHIAGYFSGSIKLGSTTLTSGGQTDVFIAKLDPSGIPIWAKSAGGPESDSATDLALDAAGNLSVTGSFHATATFGPAKISSKGRADVFVAQCNSNGQWLWASQAGGVQEDQGRSIRSDSSGNFYVAGDVRGTASFGTTQFQDNDSEHGFVAKYDPAGALLWAKTLSRARNFAWGVAPLADGALVTGQFQGTITTGRSSIVSQDMDVFVGKMDASGNFEWIERAGGPGYDAAQTIASTPSGDAFISGVFLSAQATFGCAFFSRSTANEEIFLAKILAQPVIATAPQSQSVPVGGRARFTVSVSVPDAEFQWLRDGSEIERATQSEFVIDNAQLDHAGDYSVRVKFGACTVTSAVARLTIAIPPSFTEQPASQVVDVGSQVELKSLATGSQPLTYYWFRDQTAFSSGSSAALVLTNVSPSNSGIYSVTASNAWGTAVSRPAEILVQPAGAPRIRINGQVAPRFVFTDLPSITVEIESSIAGATLFYSLDGSVPDTSSTLYSSPFPLTTSALVRAIAYDQDFRSVVSSSIPVTLSRTVNLLASTPGGGRVELDPPGDSFPVGTQVRARAIPAPGWTFLQWSGDLQGTAPDITLSMDTHKQIMAQFGTTIDASVSGPGHLDLEPALRFYPFGSRLRVAAVPNPGNYFGLWSGLLSGNANPALIILTNPTPRIAALFSTLPSNRVALTVIPHGLGSIQLEPRANLYPIGSKVLLRALPEANSQFLFWARGLSGTNNPIEITLDQDKIIQGYFTGAPALVFQPPTFTTDSIQLNLFSTVKAFVIERSSNLVQWTQWRAATNQFGPSQFIDPFDSQHRQFFYRAIANPIP